MFLLIFLISTGNNNNFCNFKLLQRQQKKNLKDYDSKSQAIIKLNDKTILYLKEVQKYIALICIIKENNYDRVFLIDYNIDVFKKGKIY